MGAFSDAWSSVSSLWGGSSGNDTQEPAAISSATGELTDAGKAMGGQEAVDANMAAGADSESAWGNFFHGMTDDNVVGGNGSTSEQMMKGIQDSQKKNLERQQEEAKQQQEMLNSGGGGGSFLPRIQSGEAKQFNPLEYQVQTPQASQGPFSGALANIRQPFQS